MDGAKEYAAIIPSGKYGKLEIKSGRHARGYYFHVYICGDDPDDQVEVYGILGGQPGWTEYYGWKKYGPWQKDLEKLKKHFEQKELEEKKRAQLEKQKEKEKKQKMEEKILANYNSLIIGKEEGK